jgi:uridine kinase
MLPEELKLAIERLLNEKNQIVIAIDGSCTAGKTTLAAATASVYDCNVIHMDEFFLRPEQRTPNRLTETGGNVDYERFFREVLCPLRAGESFTYRPFDCKRMALADPVEIPAKQLNIIEGSYSHHPYFGDSYDLRVYLKVHPQVRAERLSSRPAHLQERFFREWIPMEQRYFEAFSIEEKADLILDTTP